MTFRSKIIEPPGVGNPCNNCGACCKMAICEIGAATLGHGLREIVGDPCPALISDPSGKYFCGMVRDPEKYAWNKSSSKIDLKNAFMLMIGSGDGCDFFVEFNERDNRVVKAKAQDYIARVGIESMVLAAEIWFGPVENTKTAIHKR